MIRSALPDRIIFSLNTFRRGLYNIILLSGGTLLSYFFAHLVLGGTLPSYFPLLIFPIAATVVQRDLGSFLFETSRTEEPLGAKTGPSVFTDWVEELGGNGPKVAAYLRVSTGKQAKKGFSLDDQREQFEKLKAIRNPSRVYWFIDPGKSGRDFDKRKLNAIMNLKERGEIDELWVADVDRLGRECRKLLLFFLNLCDEGVVIRTPEKEYDLKDLSRLLMFTIEAWAAQQVNESRAKKAMAGKAQAFKQKHWNKPVPIGYRKAKDGWLERIPDPNWEPLIKDGYTLFLRTRKIEPVRRFINEKYRGFLPKPLARHQIKRVLSDPIYMGKPQHLGVITEDPSLVYVDEKTFVEAQKVLECVHRGHSRKKRDALQDFVKEYGPGVLEFIPDIAVLCPDCQGVMIKNGTVYVGGWTAHNYLCRKCGKQRRVPTKRQMRKIQEWAQKEGLNNKKVNRDLGI